MVNVVLFVILLCIIIVCCVLFIFGDWFFGKKTTIAEKVKYVGALIGGGLLVLNAWLFYEQTKEQNQSNYLVAKGKLDMRFNDAATLLASGNTSFGNTRLKSNCDGGIENKRPTGLCKSDKRYFDCFY